MLLGFRLSALRVTTPRVQTENLARPSLPSTLSWPLKPFEQYSYAGSPFKSAGTKCPRGLPCYVWESWQVSGFVKESMCQHFKSLIARLCG